jgi:transposase InsO family protein
MDGHRLDAVITLEVMDADGTRRDLPLERLWLLVVIDEASRAILGYTVSLESNYTTEDVMRCIAHCLIPWSPKEMPSTRVRYRPGAGLPSGILPGCAMRGFDSLAFDNAKAHTSERLQRQIIRTVGCEINTGRPARALSRAIVERFFKTFEEDSLHRWPSTTGSGPKDPRRHKPDAAANGLRITLEDLELAVDLTIANYNASVHTALNGRTPLEYIQYYDSHGLSFPRHLRENRGDKLPLFDREFARKIGGNEKLGRRPYVIFMGARYSSPTLNTMIEYIGKKVTLVVNTEDIRYIACFLADGTSIGLLAADAPWLRQRHSLRTRQAIMKLIKAGQLPRETYNPIGDHLHYLKKRASLTRRDRNKLLKQSREAGPMAKHQRLNHPLTQAPAGNGGWISITDAHTN